MKLNLGAGKPYCHECASKATAYGCGQVCDAGMVNGCRWPVVVTDLCGNVRIRIDLKKVAFRDSFRNDRH
jgi:hypothetical protein